MKVNTIAMPVMVWTTRNQQGVDSIEVSFDVVDGQWLCWRPMAIIYW
jgi:hypothetical protein